MEGCTCRGRVVWRSRQYAIAINRSHWSCTNSVFPGSDFAAFTFLSTVPYYYFLATFYVIRPTTVITGLAIDTLVAYIPFYTFKVSSSIHSIKTPKGVAANRSVINDFGVQAATSLFAAGIYAVVVLLSYTTWLPIHLVLHFEGIRDISLAHNSNFPYLIASFLPIGFAAKVFLFTPAEAAKPDDYDKKIAKFNPENATLRETLIYNLFGYSHRTRTLMRRTATLAVIGGLHTWLRTYITVEGSEILGAAGWSSVWSTAAVVTGLMFVWVGDV